MADSSRKTKFDQLRQLAEDLLSQRPDSDASPVGDFAELLHELEVHHIELEMQHTELEHTYRALEQSQRQYADLFDFAPVGYVITDREGIVQRANLTIATMLGVERSNLKGNRFSSYIVDDYKDSYYIHRRTVFRTKEQQGIDVRLRRADKSDFSAHLLSEVVTGNNETSRTAIMDISQIKQAEATLERALYREKELNALKSQLIEVIAHELRTPLATILSSIDILDRYHERLTDTKRQTHFERIRTYVWYLTDVVQDVVLAYRSNNDAPAARTDTFDVIPFLESMVSDISALDSRSGRVDLSIQTCQESELVTWDQHLIRRIIVNLLQNALKYSEDRVNCSLVCQAETLIFEVRDQGQGIPTDDHPHIFDMFYRGGNTVSIPGTGVGLGIVKIAVELHKGSIDFTTGEAGTTFTVQLPRHVEDRS